VETEGYMSRKSKSTRRSRGGRGKADFMPLSGAGLIRFFKEETGGLSVSPYVVVAIAIALIVIVLLMPMLIPL